METKIKSLVQASINVKQEILQNPDLLKILERYGDVLFLGDFAEKIVGLLPGAKIAGPSWQPRPEIVGALGADYFKKRKFVKVEDLEPLYVYSRECDITGK